MAGIAVLKDNVQLWLSETGEFKLDDKVGNVVSIGDIGGELEEIDCTTLESLAKEFVAGFEDNGSTDITLNVVDDEYAKMSAWKKSGKNLYWALNVNDVEGEQILGLKGQGFIKSNKLTGLSVGSLVQTVASLRFSGEIAEDFVVPSA